MDAVLIMSAMLTAQLTRFGTAKDPSLSSDYLNTNYWTLTLLFAAFWWIVLEIWGARDLRILGAGSEEYKRVVVSTMYLFGGIAIISYALDLSTARGYVGIALPVGLFLLLLSRWFSRRWLVRHRLRGNFTRRLLLVGAPSAVEHLYNSLSSEPGAGFEPIGAILPGYAMKSPKGEELPVPVVSVSTGLSGILSAVEFHDVDAIALSSDSQLNPVTIRQLGWELQERRVSMILAPALTDIAGPRIHTQPVAGLPLIHVSTPRLKGGQASLKRTFDILGSTIGLLLLSPFFLLIAALIKLDSPGPAFFHQERVGLNGKAFKMHKFRSMVVDAEAQLMDLQPSNEGNAVLFKMKDDPRITKLGAFIRRYSIDELPQLWNVLVGEMSMVGPRPPLPAEVAAYEKYVSRRLMVKPGVTGLWQVSGRSDLSWEESVRLDLYYVENWSLMQDLIILFRTVKAVFGKDGAY
ncbi:polyprenyl glycosylphosphotransferase [Arthrobacter sp. MYb227]|uniref:sugar transferase n=1 Tax=Arthrobacter sp. MYb227 TaxID=1848601 RepID=UPI000CFCB101|nr:sugar transferase [Arthrobacter sp. MYb227]PQZ87723.1 polyprenyl glycosylphosphotransferase [Arthrobacter sp. MYb227]